MKKEFFILVAFISSFTLIALSACVIAELCCCLSACDGFDCGWLSSCYGPFVECSESYCTSETTTTTSSTTTTTTTTTTSTTTTTVPTVCPRSEYDSYDKAAEGQIACGGTLAGCLWKTDNKYYKVEGTAGKEVNVTVKHSGEGCEKNDLYIYGSSRYTEIGRSTGRYETDSWEGEPETDFIVVRVAGDDYQRNENCKWNLEVTCEDICEDINQKCTGPFTVIDARLTDVLEGCLYAHHSKVYSVTGTKNMKVQVRVTHFGDEGCEEKNDLIIYDTCSKEIVCIENESVETWIGKNVNNDIKVEIHSDSDNKNCLWKLEIDYLSEDCLDRCTAADGSDCSPHKCVEGGICSLTRCDKTFCGAECESDDHCEEGWHCSSDCECVEGISRTISMQQGWNLISSPFKEFETDTECELDASIFGYDTTGKNYEVVSSLDDMVGGYGYWVKVKENCEITFVGVQLVTYVDLDAGWNMIGTVNNEKIELDNIRGDCVVTASLYKYDTDSKNYAIATSLRPGIGYWIKVNADCTIETD